MQTLLSVLAFCSALFHNAASPGKHPMQQFENSNVHLYCAWFDEKKLAQYLQNGLIAADKKRAVKLVREADQKKWLFARAMLRRVLSKYLFCAPCDIAFENNAHGKPFVPKSPVQFNLSHSGDCVLIGVTLQHDIGVDIEKVRENRDILALAKRFFSSTEFLAIQSAETPAEAFYRCWTRKEAFIKATGLGLSFGLSNFEVTVDAHADHASALLRVYNDAKMAKQWCVRSVVFKDFEKNYFAAFAVKNEASKIMLECFVI